MRNADSQIHVIVEFPGFALPLHFRAEESAARAFLVDMARWHSRAVVRLDRAVSAGMQLLPCHRLFEDR
ncbi:hypothetical protein [Nocardia sp. BMG111209]|uniref:hypothetical protein n=1 Tax=Nocardia sp. BMG111209 TaxID=1160137 RepID=UPI000378887F|nr:hypothetical protein [Nocardia sp. BMG111209]